jgi:hypothetical protein
MIVFDVIRLPLLVVASLMIVYVATIAYRTQGHRKGQLVWPSLGFLTAGVLYGASNEFESAIGSFFANSVDVAALLLLIGSAIEAGRIDLRSRQ